jgi:glycosyltransferase involved in cell wall biosynthesis
MSHPRIAIATPARNAWSETFIAAHLERLHEVVLVLSDGSLPYTANDRPLLQTNGLLAKLSDIYRRKAQHVDQRTLLRERITEQLRKDRVDVLLAEYGPTGSELLDSSAQASVPLVVHFHGFDAYSKEPLEGFAGYRELLSGAAAIVVVSRHMEQQLLALGAPRERLHLIHYGIDVERFTPGTPAAHPPHFLSVGRFVDKKAPLITLLAFREVWQQRAQARLTMVGTGVLWESVRQLTVALGLESVVKLTGVLTPDQVAEHMRASRAFVQHSVVPGSNDHEGTPLAVLEAMASGLPVVSTRHAGIPDVVLHGLSGLLSGEYDIHAMADHMLQLTDDPALASGMGQEGRTYAVKHHRVQERIGALQQVLEQVAAHSAPSGGI